MTSLPGSWTNWRIPPIAPFVEDDRLLVLRRIRPLCLSEHMKRSVSTNWKAVAVLMMIFMQVISGGVCATLADRSLVASGPISLMQERSSPTENRTVLVSDADHHVRCDQRCSEDELGGLRYSQGLQYSIATDVFSESLNYRISRPPKHLG